MVKKIFKYFFAECCLQVHGNDEILNNSQLQNFREVLPYIEKVDLFFADKNALSQKNLTEVFTGAGVCISAIDTGNWLFSSEDSENPCHIEANGDYSVLKGIVSTQRCRNKRILMDNFIQLLRIAIECCLIRNGGISIHASCVSLQGKALLFTAPSGTGKSTQAAVWENFLGARIVSGDRPMLRILPGEIRAYGVPWDGKEQIFRQENYPAIGIVEVRRAESNSLRTISEEQAFRLLMNQCFIPMWDDAAKFSVVGTIRQIAQNIPFYRLFCLPHESAAELLNGILFEGDHIFLREVQTDLKLKDGFILRNIAEEWIAMPNGKNIKNFEGALILNEVSAFIWSKLEKQISRGDLLQAMLDEFDITEQTASSDLDSFLIQMKENELLQEV